MRRRRRRRISDEINLTPLLDVLFSILFIVMLAGAFSEKSHADNVEANKSKISELEATNEQLQASLDVAAESISAQSEENASLEAVNESLSEQVDVLKSSEIYADSAVVVTARNTVEGENHFLKIYIDESEYESILLGNDSSQYISERLGEVVKNIADGAGSVPVFIVYYCDADRIYTREERAIEAELADLQETYKQVFYQIIIEEDK